MLCPLSLSPRLVLRRLFGVDVRILLNVCARCARVQLSDLLQQQQYPVLGASNTGTHLNGAHHRAQSYTDWQSRCTRVSFPPPPVCPRQLYRIAHVAPSSARLVTLPPATRGRPVAPSLGSRSLVRRDLPNASAPFAASIHRPTHSAHRRAVPSPLTRCGYIQCGACSSGHVWCRVCVCAHYCGRQCVTGRL